MIDQNIRFFGVPSIDSISVFRVTLLMRFFPCYPAGAACEAVGPHNLIPAESLLKDSLPQAVGAGEVDSDSGFEFLDDR